MAKEESIRTVFRISGIVLFLVLLLPVEVRADCATATMGNQPAGKMIYNDDHKVFQYCNGTNWVPMHSNSSGSGGCSNPSRNEGRLAFHQEDHVLMGCAGDQWMAFGSIGGSSGNGFVQISTGEVHACGIKVDGSMWCWGMNGGGQLGQGADTTDQFTPVEVIGGDSWIDVAAGGDEGGTRGHTCGIKTDGTLWCWGWNTWGQIGNPAAAQDGNPIQVSGGGTWKDVSIGDDTTCAIKSDDTGWCWGFGGSGKRGDGTTSGTRTTPASISGGYSWKEINVGFTHACGIQTDDSIWCWGQGGNGQIGDGNTGNHSSPQAVSGGDTWKKVSAGERHSCAIKTDDSAWCWGSRFDGALGDGGATTGNQSTPVAVSGGASWDAITAAVGSRFSCGIQADDTAWCWGEGISGQLGNDSTADSNVPVQVSDPGPWGSLSAGGSNACGITIDGLLLCWGDDNSGILAQGLNSSVPYPVAVAGGHSWKTISGDGDWCALRDDDTVWCWGFEPTEVSGGGTWKQVASGGGTNKSTCGIKTDDSGWCWGFDSYGKMGNGAAGNSSVPDPISGGYSWQLLASGASNSCGIQLDGSLWCWGRGDEGQLGNGGTAGSDVPSLVPGGDSWQDVAVGGYFYSHVCAIKADGTLWCWGEGGSGQLGNNDTANQLSPVSVSGGGTWKSVSAGYDLTCAVKNDDSLWCWGIGGQGQLGDGNGASSMVPVEVAGGASWVAVSAGRFHVCGIRTNGTLWCWGYEYDGRLGNGVISGQQNSPVQVSFSQGGQWLDVAAGQSATCALLSNGSGWCWGRSDLLGTAGAYGDATVPDTTWCGSPEGHPGAISYNSSANVMQYCGGGNWVGIGVRTPPPCGGIGGLCGDGSYYIGQVGGNGIYATAAASQSSQTWNNGTTNWTVTGFPNTTDGPGNTAGLVALGDAGSPYDAAVYCNGLTNVHGHSDWYLPAKDELNLFWNGGSPVAGVLTDGTYYWSSTEDISSAAWIQRFNDGTQASSDKDFTRAVRCVRRG